MAEATRSRRRPSHYWPLGVILLLVGGAGAAYYLLVHVPRRTSYVIENRLRDLAVLAKRIEADVRVRTDAAQRLKRELLQSTETPDRVTARVQSIRLTPTECTQPVSSEPPFKRLARASVGSGEDSTATLQPGNATRAGWWSEPIDSVLELEGYQDKCWSMTVGDSIRARLRDLGEDDVVVASQKEVLYHRTRGSLRLAKLPLVVEVASSRDGEPAGAAPRSVDLLAATAKVDIRLGDRDYVLLSHPVVALADDPWVIGVIIPREDFGARVRAVPLGSLAYWPVVLVLVAVASPILKVGMMGPWDRLRRWDTRVLLVSLVVLLGCATACLASLYRDAMIDGRLDADLRTVSARMRHNADVELSRISLALERFIEKWARPRALTKNASPMRMASMFGKTRRIDGADGQPPDGLITELQAIYPFPAMMYWADADGMQVDKWTPHRATTPQLSVANAAAFQDARDGRLWGWLRGHDQPAPFAFQVRSSRNTGEVLSTVAMPIRHGDGRFLGIAAMVPQLVSLEHPVLPTDVGFAVIETDGRVVFHSARWRRLQENFFDETDAAGPIRAAMEASSEVVLSGYYRGRDMRFHVSPIKFSPWTLVVMRDREAQRTVRLDVVLTWAMSFAVYVGLFLLVLLVPVWPWTLEWLWPHPDKAPVYRAVGFVCLAAVLVAGVLVWSNGRIPGPASVGGVLLVTLSVFSYAAWRCSRAPDHLGAEDVPAGGNAVLRVGASGGVEWLVLGLLGLLATAILRNSLALALCWLVAGVGLANGWLHVRPEARRDTSPPWQLDYLVFASLLLVVLAALPSLAFWGDAANLGLESLVRRGQLKLAEQLERRERNLEHEYRVLAGIEDDALVTARKEARLEKGGRNAEIVTASFLGGPTGDGSPRCEPAPGAMLPPVLASMDLCRGAALHSPLCHLLSYHPSAAASVVLPAYHEESTQLRALVDRQAADERWTWQSSDGRTELCWYPLPLDPATGTSKRRVASRIVAEPDTEPSPDAALHPRSGRVLVPALTLAAFAALLLLVRWLAERVFGLWRVSYEAPPGGDNREYGRGVLAIGPGMAPAARENVEVFDLGDPAARLDADAVRRAVATASGIVVRHLEEGMMAPADQRAALRALETLVCEPVRGAAPPLIVLSDVDPILLLEGRADAEDGRTEFCRRWAGVMERLSRVGRPTTVTDLWRRAEVLCRVAPGERLETVADPWNDEQRRALVRECLWTPRLRAIDEELRAFESPRDGLVDQVFEASQAHYVALWARLPRDEQLVLAQLAWEGLVNPRRWATARVLAQRGLIRLLPRPQLMNESFRRFVCTEDRLARRWEEAAAASPWERVSNLLFAAGIAGAILLYLTQPEGWGRILAIVSAASGATTKLADALQLARRFVMPAANTA